MAQQPVISLNIKDLLRGGAGPPDGNYSVRKSGFAKFDYRGRGPLTTTLKLVLQNDYGRSFENHYSVGDASRFPYNENKLLFVPPKASNFGILMERLTGLGFSKEKLASGDAKIFSGLYARWENRSRARHGEERSILVPVHIHHLPGDGDVSRIVVIAEKMPAEFSRPELAWRVLKMCDDEEAKELYTAVMDRTCDELLMEQGYDVSALMIRRNNGHA